MSPQAGQSASGDLLAVKDAHIASLQTELRGKDRILQAKTKTKVGAGLNYTHIHNTMVQCVYHKFLHVHVGTTTTQCIDL